MVQAAQDGPGDNSPSRLGDVGERTLQPEAAMRSVAIVVVGELGQHRPQVALVEDSGAIRSPVPDDFDH